MSAYASADPRYFKNRVRNVGADFSRAPTDPPLFCQQGMVRTNYPFVPVHCTIAVRSQNVEYLAGMVTPLLRLFRRDLPGDAYSQKPAEQIDIGLRKTVIRNYLGGHPQTSRLVVYTAQPSAEEQAACEDPEGPYRNLCVKLSKPLAKQWLDKLVTERDTAPELFAFAFHTRADGLLFQIIDTREASVYCA